VQCAIGNCVVDELVLQADACCEAVPASLQLIIRLFTWGSETVTECLRRDDREPSRIRASTVHRTTLTKRQRIQKAHLKYPALLELAV
jgi:hypothetical protein